MRWGNPEQRWVEYHSQRWGEMVEQGWVTMYVETWAVKDGEKKQMARMIDQRGA